MGLVQAATAGERWPVHAEYRVTSETAPLGGATHLVAPVGTGQRGYWLPAAEPVIDRVTAIADLDDSALFEWVTRHGLLGLHDRFEAGETLEAMREAATQLHRCQQLLLALLEDRERGTLLQLAEEAAGHLVNARHIAETAGISGEWSEQRRPNVGQDVQALHALATSLRWPLERYTRLVPRVTADRRAMRIEAQLIGRGWIGAAYTQLLERAVTLNLNQAIGQPRLDWRRTGRECARCGRAFLPSREDQIYDSPRCRWAHNKARGRRRNAG